MKKRFVVNKSGEYMNYNLQALRDAGLEVDETLHRCLDDKEMYLSFLDKAIKDGGFRELAIAIDNRDAKTGFMVAHKLKGMLNNMGLLPLVEALFNIVESLRLGIADGLDDDFIELMRVRDELEKVIDEM